MSVLEEQLPKHRMADGREDSFQHKLASTVRDQLQYKDGPEWKNKSAHLQMDTVSPESIISLKTTPVAQKESYAQQEQEQKRELLLHMTIHEVCKYNFCSMSMHTQIPCILFEIGTELEALRILKVRILIEM